MPENENSIVASDGLVALAVEIPKPTPMPIIIDCELAVNDMTLDVETESVVIIHQ